MLMIALALLAGCAQKKDVDAMEARLAALEEKVSTLEKRAPAGPASSAEEEAANTVMKDVTEATKNGDYATAKTKLQELMAKHSNTKAGKAAEKMYREVGLVGADAKPLEVEKWYQGKVEFGDKPVTLLVFWEVWCPHCKREMPELAKREKDLEKMGIQIVGLTKITKSATEEKVLEFMKESDINFPMAKEKEGSMSEAYNVSGIPAAALVKDGKVIWRGHPGRLDDATLAKLVGA